MVFLVTNHVSIAKNAQNSAKRSHLFGEVRQIAAGPSLPSATDAYAALALSVNGGQRLRKQFGLV
jgi:hypothetical protein